jgi:hypothetical protein
VVRLRHVSPTLSRGYRLHGLHGDSGSSIVRGQLLVRLRGREGLLREELGCELLELLGLLLQLVLLLVGCVLLLLHCCLLLLLLQELLLEQLLLVLLGLGCCWSGLGCS